MKEVGEIFQKLNPVLSSTEVEQPQVGILFSDFANQFFQSEPMNNISYTEQFRILYDMLVDMGICRDVISEGADLSQYKLVIIPFLPALEESFLQKLYRFAEQGGVVIAGPMTGFRTCEHTVHTSHALGNLEALCGIHVSQFYRADHTDAIMEGFGVQCHPVHWAAPFEPLNETEQLAAYHTTLHSPSSAAARHKAGLGWVYTLAAMPSMEGEEGEQFLKGFIEDAAKQAEITLRYATDRSTLSVTRLDEAGQRYLFLINIDGNGSKVSLDGDWEDAFNQENIKEVQLDAYQYMVLKQK